MRRVVMKIGLTYNTTLEKMNEAMDILSKMPSKVKYVSENDLVVSFSDFTDSALVITFIYFIKKEGNIRKTTSDVNLEILNAFNQANLNFAFPTQSIYLENNKEGSEIINKDPKTE
jgi:MscS family membrane protein